MLWGKDTEQRGQAMNGTQHKVIGVVSGAVYGGARVWKHREEYDYKTAVPVVGAAAVGGLIGGMLPDLIEPATSPNHRGMFHSWAFLLVLAVIIAVAWKQKDKSSAARAFMEGIAVGCASHLVADSTTTKGLPVLA